MSSSSSPPGFSLLRDPRAVSYRSTDANNTFAFIIGIAVLLLAVSLSSCGGLVSSGTKPSPVLTATPANLSFGNVIVGSQSVQSVIITNTGTAAVNVSQVNISGTGFSIVGTITLPFSVLVGQNFTVQVQCAPQAAGAVNGSLSLVSDASNSPLQISLNGTGTAVVVPSQNRTVIDKEVGSIYEQPNGFSWSVYGAFVGSPQTLDPAALRVIMAHFDKFFPAEDTSVRGFPYTALRNYEAAQVAAGKPPIFVTATYAGKSRPVLWAWSLSLVNGVPTAPAANWQYAVNVQDTRFIHFWINQYIQPILNQYQSLSGFGPNLLFQLDECGFSLQNFGVLDDSNHYVPGVTWDSPFPQTEADYESGIETFFSQVKTLAPNILTVPNIGGMATPSNFPNLFANVPAVMYEDLLGWYPNPSPFVRDLWYTQAFIFFPWLGGHGKIAITRAIIPPNDPNALKTAFAVYSLLKGPNFFFAPGQGIYNIDPNQWAGMKALLGSPTSDLQSSQPSSLGSAYRLFSRNYAGGIVYLNWTGATLTVPLSGTFYDPNGTQVTQIQIPDGIGTYVSYSNPAVAVLPPRISPRYAFPAVGPVTVTIEEDTPGTTIHYTLDGSTPTTASAVYTGPFQISSSTVVQAIAYSGLIPSQPSIASYTLSSSTLPTVQLTLTSDSGPAGSYYPSLSLDAIPVTNVSVTYQVVKSGGSQTTGTATFLPGQIYSYFPLTVSGPVTVTITSAIGAVVGPNNTLQYTGQ